MAGEGGEDVRVLDGFFLGHGPHLGVAVDGLLVVGVLEVLGLDVRPDALDGLVAGQLGRAAADGLQGCRQLQRLLVDPMVLALLPPALTQTMDAYNSTEEVEEAESFFSSMDFHVSRQSVFSVM